MQTEIVPLIIKQQKLYGIQPLNDLCVCAPTGSGKTLAYVLPIIQVLCWLISDTAEQNSSEAAVCSGGANARFSGTSA